MYGIQANRFELSLQEQFENDVKMHGIHAFIASRKLSKMFENDVKMYGIQAFTYLERIRKQKPSYKDIIDLLDGASGKRIVSKGGHSVEYWEREYALEHEAYAHFFSVMMVAAQEKIVAMEQIFPTAWEAFKKVLKSV